MTPTPTPAEIAENLHVRLKEIYLHPSALEFITQAIEEAVKQERSTCERIAANYSMRHQYGHPVDNVAALIANDIRARSEKEKG